MKYIPGAYLITSGMTFKADGRVHVLGKDHEERLQLTADGYLFEFKSSLRHKKTIVKINKDMELIVGWNRITGSIKADIL